MKAAKICAAIIAALLLSNNPTKAQQNIAKFVPVAIFTQSGDGFGASYSMGIGFERVFSERISGQINLLGAFRNVGFFGNSNLAIIKPEFAIYTLDNAPYGLYLGGFLTMGFGNIGDVYIGLGPQVGYQFFFLEDRLAVSAEIELGVGFYTGDGLGAGFHTFPGVAVGYAF